jgi:NAD(P)-dependent dehydrogenase (short-subunit alcohol dehydrogenase family)
MPLTNRVAVVTGAGSGLGQAIACEMARRGAHVAALDLDGSSAEETAESINAAGGRSVGLTVDVANSESLDAAVSSAVETLGPLAIMVNNAGVLDGYQNVDEMDEDIWDRVIDIDLKGVYLGCKRALREMLPAGYGRIINMASIAGLNGTGGGAAYIAAKHGVVGLTRQMAVVYSDKGITTNCVCPGVIPTNLRATSTQVLGDSLSNLAARGIALSDDEIRSVVPAGVKGDVADIAAAACFLASEDARYVSGHSLVVDGGLRAK